MTTGEAELLREIDLATSIATHTNIEDLQSLLRRCRAMIESDTLIITAGYAENASLRAKLDERDANAERYRYIEGGEHHLMPYNGSYLRAYIDKAMAADKEWHARQSAQAASQPK